MRISLKEQELEERIKRLPLSAVFPPDDYSGLLKKGVAPIRVALAHALRDEIDPKPRLARDEDDLEGVLMDEFRLELRHYVDKVKEIKPCVEWVLSLDKIPAEAIKAAYKSRDKEEYPFIYTRGIDIEPFERNNVFALADVEDIDISDSKTRDRMDEIYEKVCFSLLGGVCDTTLRMHLYNRYGHDVSFKRLFVSSSWGDLAVRERASPYSEVIETTSRMSWPKDKYFTPKALSELIKSPRIELWYEIEADRQAQRRRCAELEEEEREEKYDNECSMAY